MAGTPKKVVDTWKLKKWYSVIAPNFLNNVEAAEVPALDDASLMNRIIQLPLKEITRDLGHVYTSIRLRVTEIQGRKAFAKFIGHSVAREYLRTLSRRRTTPIDYVVSLTSKDGVEFKVKVLIVALGDSSISQKKALRAATAKFFRAKAASQEFGEMIRNILFNKMAYELQDKLQPIFPIRKVEIWKTELKEVFDVAQVMELEKSQEQQDADAIALQEGGREAPEAEGKVPEEVAGETGEESIEGGEEETEEKAPAPQPSAA